MPNPYRDFKIKDGKWQLSMTSLERRQAPFRGLSFSNDYPYHPNWKVRLSSPDALKMEIGK
jgi:hypothetical protein